ncbi:MerR family transcriptional regulator [Actinocrispum sp. NPDC049592]|uniref:helix-turn-helix domain-containing protein n=1 Tax=Actinocrispum sp. NPDC049592 TaxID=3154835 RepID=UPI003441104C
MDEDGLWTLEQLSERVADALAVDYDGQPSGRVRELPTGRTIRWYTTIGLVDRPAGMRGRTALYTHRHLLQLVAVKRLQAAGTSLADIQRQLVGATDATLAELARVTGDASRPALRPGRFWAAAPAAANGDSVNDESLARTVHGVRLTDTVTVLLDAATRAPDAAEAAAIQAAAAPLLDLLSHLGLDRGDRT